MASMYARDNDVFTAVRQGDVPGVRTLLRDMADPNERDEVGICIFSKLDSSGDVLL